NRSNMLLKPESVSHRFFPTSGANNWTRSALVSLPRPGVPSASGARRCHGFQCGYVEIEIGCRYVPTRKWNVFESCTDVVKDIGSNGVGGSSSLGINIHPDPGPIRRRAVGNCVFLYEAVVRRKKIDSRFVAEQVV